MNHILLLEKANIWELDLKWATILLLIYKLYNMREVSYTTHGYFFFSFYFSLIQYFLTIFFPPSTPRIPWLTFPLLQKMSGLPGIATEQGITRCSKTRYKPSYQGWMRWPSSGKGVPNTDKRLRDTPIHTPTVRSSMRTPSYTFITYIWRT